jgi:hypothetical protein
MRNFGHKIAKPSSFLRKPDFAGFHCLFTGFHGLFKVFHGVIIFYSFRKSHRRAFNFSSMGYRGGGTFLGIVSQKYDFKNNHIEKTSVLKA